MRTTLGRIDDPRVEHVDILPRIWASNPKALLAFSSTLPATTAPSTPAFSAIWRSGCWMARAYDPNSGILVGVFAVETGQDLAGMDQGGTATGHDTFLYGGAGGVQGVIDAVLALLHLDLGRAADADYRNAAGQLGQAFVQFLLVII